jgi:hypothetical protein
MNDGRIDMYGGMIWHEWRELTWMEWFDMDDMILHEWQDFV